jgi:hypothetical protein
VAAAAAVVVFAGAAGVALLWDVNHPPAGVSRPSATASPTPSTTPPAAAAALLRASAAALRAVSTAHVAGVVGAPTPVRVDLSVTQNSDAQGTLVVGGVPVDVVRTGDRTFLRSRRFVENVLGGTVASYVGDRWLELGTSGLAGTGVTDALDEATSLDGIASLVSAGADLAQGGVRTTHGGRHVVEVVTGPTVVDVAADGLPYPLRVTAGEGTELTLDSFGAPVVVTPPRDGVVDLSRLPGIG